MRTHNITLALCALLTLSFAASCQKDNSRTLAPDTAVGFRPTVSGIGALTKGALINDNDNGDYSAIPLPTGSKFYVGAWDVPAAGNPYEFISAFTEVSYSTSASMWKTSAEYIWKNGHKMDFLAYTNLPAMGSSVSATVNTTTHKVEMTLSHTVPTTASAQTDILMGGHNGDGAGTGTASITFSHPLASVILTMGTISGTASFEIKSIGIEGIWGSGTAVMTVAGSSESSPEDRFVWRPVLVDGEPVITTVSQTVSTTPASGSGETIGEPFLIIPQSFATDSGARIVLSVTVDGKNVNLYIPLNGNELKAGYTSTYSVNFNGHEGIQIWENGPYWAPANVGAQFPEDYGWFFSWGNVDGYVPSPMTERSTGVWNCKWIPAAGGSPVPNVFGETYYNFTPTPGSLLSSDIPAGDTYDAAFKCCSEKWRMPTKAEMDALIANTTISTVTRNGHKGYLFRGKGDYRDRFIFLPASGYGAGSDYYSYEGEKAFYWSSGIVDSNSCWCIEMNEGTVPSVTSEARHLGGNIRAVENVE